jgi:hypothetical protein
MVARHLHLSHEFVCVTDDPEGIDPRVRTIPLWPEISEARHARRPNCYRRLRAFAPDAGEWLGERIFSIDLDSLLTADITPLVDRPEDFVIYGDTAQNTPYNGSMWLLKAGSRTKVWTDFDPERTPLETEKLRIIGSDQAAIALALGPNEAKYGKKDGVYSFGRDIMRNNGGKLPKDCRAVMMFGKHDPETVPVKWVKEHWK